jgi:protein TonB
MTAATAGPSGTNGFSLFSGEGYGLYRTKQEVLLLSMLGQALVVGLLVYFLSCVAPGIPGVDGIRPLVKELPLVFSGRGGGGGGNFEKSPASHGSLPRTSFSEQLAPPTVIVPKEMPKLPVESTIMVAPDVPLPHGGQLGDPMAPISSILSNGPGGPGGTGSGCCGGVGPSEGPGFGPGPRGVRPGVGGVTVPRLIYSPEPAFSDEARKSKTQGSVTLLLVVGADGRTYDIHVQSSLGMGLDEKAIEAVRRWRFQPATFKGQPVATQIAVEVNFHLY